MHHAVADKPVVAVVARRVLRIRAVAVERAAQRVWQLAADRQVVRIALHQDRREVAGQAGKGREGLGHGAGLLGSWWPRRIAGTAPYRLF
ncbi:hypothetical protein D3C86_1979450 [compost metagenome]